MPPRGRRPVGGTDTREQILTAAGELFSELGFERTTMRAVAARADVDAALIHHYFVNKEGLLAAALVLPVDPAALLAGLNKDPAHAGEAVVRRVLGVWEADPQTRRTTASPACAGSLLRPASSAAGSTGRTRAAAS